MAIYNDIEVDNIIPFEETQKSSIITKELDKIIISSYFTIIQKLTRQKSNLNKADRAATTEHTTPY